MCKYETGRFFFENVCYKELAAMFFGSCLVREGEGGGVTLF